MAPQVQLVTYATVGTRRVSADASYVTVEMERVAVDGGNILESSLVYKTPGLMKSMVSWKFNADPALEKFILAHQLAAPSAFVNKPTQVQLDPGTPGSIAYILTAGFREFKRSGEHGQLAEWTATQDLSASRPWVGATLLNTVLDGAPIDDAFDSTPVEFLAIDAGFEAYFLCVVGPDPGGISGTSPTFDATLQSAADEAFTVPVDRGTFDSLTDEPGVQIFTFDGDDTAITDTWWRISISAPGGTTPSYHVIASFSVSAKLA